LSPLNDVGFLEALFQILIASVSFASSTPINGLFPALAMTCMLGSSILFFKSLGNSSYSFSITLVVLTWVLIDFDEWRCRSTPSINASIFVLVWYAARQYFLWLHRSWFSTFARHILRHNRSFYFILLEFCNKMLSKELVECQT